MRQNVPDPNYIRAALESHQQCAERCRVLITTAATEEERETWREQLISAENEIQRWKARQA